jgi:hypothetical protein
MSLAGSLDDVSVADVMQFINLGGRSGTLSLVIGGARRGDGEQRAEIGFHRGRIISARGPDHLPLGEWLVSKGAVSPSDIDQALRIQKRMGRPAAIGKVLIEMGVITLEKLKELVEAQIENTVYGLVGWSGGTFEFSVDELKPVDDLSMSPGDILPDINVNTQMVLLEAARILDERSRNNALKGSGPYPIGSAPSDSDRPTDSEELAPRTEMGRAAEISGDAKVVRAQLVTPDQNLYLQVSQALCVANATVVRTSPRDAGTRLPGEAAPIVLVDLRDGMNDQNLLATIRRTRSRATLVAIVDSVEHRLDAYEQGAVAVVPSNPFAIASCVSNLLRVTDGAPAVSGSLYARAPELAKLNRVFGELRSGLLTASVSLNLMNLVSESVDRAVLFVAAPKRLVVLGAYGYTALQQSLAEHSRNYWIPIEQGGAMADTLRDGRSRTLVYEDANLPDSFTALIGRPSSGSCAVFPLLGSRKVIATMYVDNGKRHTPINDVELLEIATAQVGMFYENELLRRQLASYAQSAG